MRKKPRQRRRGRDDLVGPKYQFNRALAQEMLCDPGRADCCCLLCDRVGVLMFQLVRYLSSQECRRYQLPRDHGVVVVVVCESCMHDGAMEDLINQKIRAALDRREVLCVDLGALDLPEFFS